MTSNWKGLKGMLRALQHHPRKEFSMLCDCKGVVRYINHQYCIPYHYGETCQKIQEQKTQLIAKGIHHEITRIPGHTNYKLGTSRQTNCWLPNFKPPSFLSLIRLTIRHFSQFWDTDGLYLLFYLFILFIITFVHFINNIIHN